MKEFLSRGNSALAAHSSRVFRALPLIHPSDPFSPKGAKGLRRARLAIPRLTSIGSPSFNPLAPSGGEGWGERASRVIGVSLEINFRIKGVPGSVACCRRVADPGLGGTTYLAVASSNLPLAGEAVPLEKEFALCHARWRAGRPPVRASGPDHPDQVRTLSGLHLKLLSRVKAVQQHRTPRRCRVQEATAISARFWTAPVPWRFARPARHTLSSKKSCYQANFPGGDA
jgi:hypothetical protein